MMPGSKNLKLTLIIVLSILCVPAQAMAAEQNSGIGIGFLKMQKLWQGVIEKPKMTNCRLASQRSYLKKQICVYSGSNNTIVAIYNDAGAFCSREMRCKYDPDNSKKVSDLVKKFIKGEKRKN